VENEVNPLVQMPKMLPPSNFPGIQQMGVRVKSEESNRMSQNLRSLIEKPKEEEVKIVKKSEVLSEQMATDKIIQLMADLIINKNVCSNEFSEQIQQVCSSNEKLKTNQYLQRIIFANLSCKICAKKYVLEDFSLIECQDSKKCMVCNKCRLKNALGICDICKRVYTDYEKYMIKFANDD
jgi:hypothetical protein